MTLPTDRTLIFVYGTLKRGGSNHRFLAGQSYVGDARTVPGFRLHHLGAYPGMVAAPDDRDGVTGEVWSVDATSLARLDALEDTAEGLYRREPVPLLSPFANQSVESYLYALGITGRPVIPGGVWVE